MFKIWLLIRYILSAAFRDRLFFGFIVLIVLAISLSTFLGSAAVIERDQFSIVFAASSLRIGGMLILVLFIVSYLRRSFEGSDVEYLLSRPLSRCQFLLAHSFSFSLLATIVTLCVALPLLAFSSSLLSSGFMLWTVSLWVEFIIMANVALFFAMTLSSPVICTAMSVAFYVLARLIGDILGIIETQADQTMVTLFMEKIMLVVSVFVPRLDLLGQSAWLVYGAPESVISSSISFEFVLLQGGVFCGLLFFATLLDFNRRQF